MALAMRSARVFLSRGVDVIPFAKVGVGDKISVGGRFGGISLRSAHFGPSALATGVGGMQIPSKLDYIEWELRISKCRAPV